MVAKDSIETMEEGKTFNQLAVNNVHKKQVDALEHLKCFSEYTPSMELGDDTTRVMLDLPTELVKNAIQVSEEVNARYKEERGEDEEWGLSPFDVLTDAYQKTDIMHYRDDAVEHLVEEFKDF